jgi:hypothetical protein
MTVSLRQAPLRVRVGFLGLGLILLLSVLFVLLPPDGQERAAWAQFIGRFHLLTVHFPIALILLCRYWNWPEGIAAFLTSAPRSILYGL